MFRMQLVLVGDISGWQTLKLQYMNFTFANADSFNVDINSWDVEEVVNMN